MTAAGTFSRDFEDIWAPALVRREEIGHPRRYKVTCQGSAAVRLRARAIAREVRSLRPRVLSPAVVLALAAIVIQAFVVQVHVHFNVDLRASLVTEAAPSLFDSQALSTGGDADNCLICHEQMSGGRALAIDAAHLLPPNAAIFVALYAEALSAAYGIISHSWHGRGPPWV